MEIELPDGTVLEAPDDADPKAVVRGYRRSLTVAKNPEEYDVNSPEYIRKYSAAEQQKQWVGLADPKTGKDLSQLSPDERTRFFSKDVKYLDAVDRKGKRLKDLTPQEQTEYWAAIDKTTQPKMNADNMRAAVGSGMLRGWKGLTNLVLPDSITPEWASDQNIQEMDKRDAALPTSGKMVGSVAGTYPLSMGTGALLSRATQAAPAGGVLAKALASPWTRAAVEGGTQGAIYADPEHQGQGALAGTLFSLGLRGLGQGAKRFVDGPVAKSEETKLLQQLAEQHGDEMFVPISQGADDKTMGQRLVKTLYKEALPIVPGVKGRLERQSADAAEQLRAIALKEAVPTGGTLPQEAGSKVLSAVEKIQQQFDDAYDQTVKSYAFNVPSSLKEDLTAKVSSSAGPKSTLNSQTLNKVVGDTESLLRQFSNGTKIIDGSNLLTVKRRLSGLMAEAQPDEIPAYRAADEWIDDLIETELKQGGSKQNLADLQRYKDLTPAWRAFRPVQEAARQSSDKEGRFLFRTLARAAERSPEQRMIGQLGAATLDKPAAAGTMTGKILAGLGMAGTGIGAFMSLPATGAMLTGGNALASKSFQKALYGDTALQKALQKLITDHPELLERLSTAGRTGLVSEAVRPNE